MKCFTFLIFFDGFHVVAAFMQRSRSNMWTIFPRPLVFRHSLGFLDEWVRGVWRVLFSLSHERSIAW